jgi:putative ubiquitin-RnfH superfamily antitoxin RatB of RatAB toxin-antitoxin module
MANSDITHHSPEEAIHVQVACALPDRQSIVALQARRQDTVMDAIQQSGLLEQFPGLAQTDWKVGNFGQLVSPETLLEEGMRIEIYRPLQMDPKTSRRQRARAAKARIKTRS